MRTFPHVSTLFLFVKCSIVHCRLCAPTASEPTEPAPVDEASACQNEQPKKSTSSLTSMLKEIVEEGVENVVKGLLSATEGSFTDVYHSLDQHNKCLA